MEWQIYKALQVHKHENNVREHYYCIKQIFDLYNTKERLEKLAAREDLDTVCAFEYYEIKKNAQAGLNYFDFNPEAKGIKIPEFKV